MPGDWEVFRALVKNYAPRVEKVIENARTPRDAAYTLLMSQLVEDFIDQVKANRAGQEPREFGDGIVMLFSSRKRLADELWPKWVSIHTLPTQDYLEQSKTSRSAFMAGAMMAAAEMSRRAERKRSSSERES